MSNRIAQLNTQLRSQVVSLRRAGMAVSEICERLGVHKSSEIEGVKAVCESLPRKYGLGEVAPRGPVTRTRGARR